MPHPPADLNNSVLTAGISNVTSICCRLLTHEQEVNCRPEAISMAGNGIYHGFAGRVGQGLFIFGGNC